MRMPFGKYAGLEVNDVPRQYLQWLRRQPNLRGPLVKEIDEVLNGNVVAEADKTFEELLGEMKEAENG